MIGMSIINMQEPLINKNVVILQYIVF